MSVYPSVHFTQTCRGFVSTLRNQLKLWFLVSKASLTYLVFPFVCNVMSKAKDMLIRVKRRTENIFVWTFSLVDLDFGKMLHELTLPWNVRFIYCRNVKPSVPASKYFNHNFISIVYCIFCILVCVVLFDLFLSRTV